MKNKFEQATVNQLTKGFIYNSDTKAFSCLFCKMQYEDGNIYSFGNCLVDAKKAIHLHILEKHKSVFEALLTFDKRQIGLTDMQKELLMYFYNGMSDKYISKETNTALSTIRFQRHNFREKAKQAKMILAISELLEEKLLESNTVDIKNNNDNSNENDDAKIDTFFESVTPLVLKSYSVKFKNQLFILKIIAQQFEAKKKYTENEINEVLKPIYSDYSTLRRELVDYKFLKRTSDGKEYWLNV